VNNNFNVIISKEFYRMLDCHIEFLTRVSAPAARKLNKAVFNAITSLAERANSYPVWIKDYAADVQYRCILVNKRYLIIYYVAGENIFVDYLFDSRMDNSKFFTKI